MYYNIALVFLDFFDTIKHGETLRLTPETQMR